jgi:tripartite-type tricarboxylate transporter receptor subunit TctC
MKIALTFSVLLALASAAGLATPAYAQGYPAKEITAVCPFAAGTGADITVRYFSAKLSEVLGKPVIVLNKAGATGNIASETVAKAKPDGYTFPLRRRALPWPPRRISIRNCRSIRSRISRR